MRLMLPHMNLSKTLPALLVTSLLASAPVDARPKQVGTLDGNKVYDQKLRALVIGDTQKSLDNYQKDFDDAFKVCPGGYRELSRSAWKENTPTTLRFVCLTPIKVPKLPYTKQIGTKNGKPRLAVFCAAKTPFDCTQLAYQSCKESSDTVAHLDGHEPKKGENRSNLVLVGKRARPAVIFSYTCDK